MRSRAPGHAPLEVRRPSPSPSASPPVRPPGPLPAPLAWALAHPLPQRMRAFLTDRNPLVVLGGAMAAWFVTFAVPLLWRHERFGTFDHDLGIWDQAIWLLANGRDLITVRGLRVFGFHASPALYLYVPFYRLGAGVAFLNLSMVAALCAGAVPLFRAARHHLGNEWHALVPALAFLVNYAAQWMLQETFHPEVMAVTPFLFAYLAAIEGRWRAYAAWAVLALAWKEDIALAVLALGVVLAVRGTRGLNGRLSPAATRRVGLLTIAGAAIWFLVATRLAIPHFSPGGNFTENLFGDLGTSPTEIARNSVTHPDLVGQHLQRSQPDEYLRHLAGSFGFVPLLSPLPLLIGLPQTAINLLAVYDFFWTTKVHYAAMPLTAMAIAAAEGAARVRRMALRRAVLAAMAVGTFFTAVSWGVFPLSESFRSGFWPLEPRADQALYERAVTRPGPTDAVSAAYFFVPHLTHRDGAYTFPNPWVASNWGVDGENRPDPRTVDWLLVNPAALGPPDRAVLFRVLDDPDRLLQPGDLTFPAIVNPETVEPPAPGEVAAKVNPRHWTVVTDEPSLLVLRRRPG